MNVLELINILVQLFVLQISSPSGISQTVLIKNVRWDKITTLNTQISFFIAGLIIIYYSTIQPAGLNNIIDTLPIRCFRNLLGAKQ